MKRTFLYLSSAAILLALASCTATSDKADSTLAFSRLEMTDTYRLAGSAADYDAAADLSYNCTASLLLPEDLLGKDVTPLRNAIFTAAFDTTGTDAKAIVDHAFRTAAADNGYALADTTVDASACDGVYSVDGGVKSMNSKRLSYAVTISQYIPRAAHGMYGTYFVTYDLDKGQVVKLADLFTAGGLNELPSIIRTTAEQMQAYIGMTDIKELPSRDNFYVSSDGEVVFVYQPYEVASYAQGEISVPIQSYLLENYLTQYGKSFLLGQ